MRSHRRDLRAPGGRHTLATRSKTSSAGFSPHIVCVARWNTRARAYTHTRTPGQDQFTVVTTEHKGVRAGFNTHFSQKYHSVFMWP